jgi:predicted RNase H-like nuclease (RuvC/YqgF family)
MATKTIERKELERMMPLLRSISRELAERSRAIESLEARLHFIQASPQATRAHADEISGLEAQLSAHRRELRQISKEVRRLGCELDEGHPMRILLPTTVGAGAGEPKLDDTRFYRPLGLS